MGLRQRRRPLETEEVLGRLRAFFASRLEVRMAWLFGSRGRGQSTPMADVDVAVYCGGAVPPVKWGYQAQLSSELADVLEDDAVDVVLLDDAPPLLTHRVIRDGVLLACRDEVERIRFTVEAVGSYLDTAHMREFHIRRMKQRILAGEGAWSIEKPFRKG